MEPGVTMVLCTQCGRENTDHAQFCQSCHAFLPAMGEPAVESQPASSPGVVPDAGAVDDRGDKHPGTAPTVAVEQSVSTIAAGTGGLAQRIAAASSQPGVSAPSATATRRRPRRSPLRRVGPVLRWGVFLVGLISLGAVGYLTTAADAVRDRLASLRREPVPVDVRAARATSGAPELAIDLRDDTAWTAVTGPGESITLELAEAASISWVGVILGERPAADPDAVAPRARSVDLVFDDGSRIRLELDDVPGFQVHPVEAPTTSSITVEIVDVRPGQQRDDVSIVELELWRSG